MPGLTRRDGDPPLYAQLADLLTTQMRSGVLAVGDQLPTEHALAEQYGLSRATVVKALGTLERRGLVVKRQGRGTFVTAPPMERPLHGLGGFSQHVGSLGLTPGHDLLRRFRTRTADDPLHEAFGEGVEVLELHRRRSVSGSVVGLQRSIVPLDIALDAGLEDEGVKAPDFSLYRRLHDTPYTPRRATESLRAINCSAPDAELLQVDPGTALIEAVRQSHDARGRLVEVAEARYLGSWYVYRVELTQPDQYEGP